MEIVDKRRKTDEWHAGDVICYWDDPNKKHYGLVIKPDLRTNGGCGIVTIGSNRDR